MGKHTNTILGGFLALVTFVGVFFFSNRSAEKNRDQAPDDQVHAIFTEAYAHFAQAEFTEAIASYQKILDDPILSKREYGQDLAQEMAQEAIENTKCVQQFETSREPRTLDETIRGFLANVQNQEKALDFISCRVCENYINESVCRYLSREETYHFLKGKIKPNAKTFLADELPEERKVIRITNETEDKSDDVILSLVPNDFSPERYRIERVFLGY